MTDAHDCCPEYRLLTRRRLLQLGGAGLAAATLGLPRVALADLPTDRRFVFVLLRGGLDGLAAIAPTGDRDYAKLRGALALQKPGPQAGRAIHLTNLFSLHPALSELEPFWDRQQLAVIHAVASPYRERSHFDAQNLLEIGMDQPHAANDGWLNRALSLYGGEANRMGLALSSTIPLVLAGQVPVASWSPGRADTPDTPILSKIAMLYQTDPLFAAALSQGQEMHEMADAALGDMGGRVLRRGGESQVARAAGTLLANPGGARLAVIELTGWDTHANQGAENGQLAQRLGTLSDTLTGLAQSMAPVWDQTVVVALTEFGRTVRVNGTGGTDHGTAGVALVMGGAVRGKQALGEWPGLNHLYQDRDLAPTTDTRAILKAVLEEHLQMPGNEINRRVFPGSASVRPLDKLIA